ncbi:MAG: glutamyl-tRNA reductase, partial [Candidatus Methanoperedens sp.]|nr:glutamyl-tRNA reductase [Candidatus Methanoperedens sp.]
EKMEEYIPRSDVVISATKAPHFVLTQQIMSRLLEKRKKGIMLVDIGNPRNIESSAGDLPGVSLHNIDSLKSISEANLNKRRAEAKKAEIIIEEE